MLQQRILTAIALLVVLLPALFHPDIRYLALIGMVLIGAAVWEWSRLNHFSPSWSVFWGLASVAVCALIYFTNALMYFNAHFWLFVSASWVLFGGYLLKGGQARWLRSHRFVRIFLGFCILTCAWLALFQSKLIGTGFLLSILLLVWVADVCAYFVGRRWGKHKLAPEISPGKSWEGLIGGILGVFILSMIWLNLDDVFPMLRAGLFQKLHSQGWLIFILSLLFITLMSVVGDLVESLIKRSVGAKDSSRLLPGHGGVLDRLDALLPVLPISMMLILSGVS